MSRQHWVFAVILLTLFGVLGGLSLARDRSDTLWGRVFVGPGLIELVSPEPEPASFRPLGSVAVLVRFPGQERVAHETFRCLLNGRDVTEQLTVTRLGAGGSVFPLLEGENDLRVEVFGRGWWSSAFYEDVRELRFLVRGPVGFDIAFDSAGPVSMLAPDSVS